MNPLFTCGAQLALMYMRTLLFLHLDLTLHNNNIDFIFTMAIFSWQMSHYKSLLLLFLHKVHVFSSSAVPDHCRAYALSFPEDPDYVFSCHHSHVDTCDRCVHLASVVNEIEDALKEAECTNDTREELVFVASQAKQHIHSWKSHLLRSTNQDDCRLLGYEISTEEISRKSDLLVRQRNPMAYCSCDEKRN